MKLKHIFLVVATCALACVASAQKFEIKSLKATASWGIGGMDRVKFESHSFDNILRYDSFIPVLKQFMSDVESGGIVIDSLSSPVKIHYMIFSNDQRKLTVENPEFLAAGFDLQEELDKNRDSLPSNVIYLYDDRYKMKLSIYLEQPGHAYKLQKMVERWDLSAQTLEADIVGDLDSIRPPLSASSSIFNFDYRVFKKLMRNTCLQTSKGEFFTKPRVSLYAFEYNSVIKNDDTLSVTSLAITSIDRGLSDLYSSVGFLGNNVCTQIGGRIPLSVKYKMDLPVKVFYLNLGSTLYSVSGENNSVMKKNGYYSQLEIKGFYEVLLGFRTMNTSPDLKALKDYRVKGIELGGFLSDRDGALLPHAGLVLKSYKQLGNVRFTSGIYTGKTISGESPSILSALLFTIEVFDLF
jgi:hypothetical protein